MIFPGLDRLGLGHLVRDHNSTLYRLDLAGVRKPRLADRLLLWGLPVAVGAVTGLRDIRLFDLGALLNGVAILTGGLFTLLVMIYGVQAVSHQQTGAVDRVFMLVKETRANVAYATGLALLLTFALMVTDGVQVPTPDGKQPAGLNTWATAAFFAALAHLGLVLLLVLNRIRIAFARL